MQRQLPQITQRLNSTLEKLRSPRHTVPTEVRADTWWNDLLQRYNGRAIEFVLASSVRDAVLPAELFDLRRRRVVGPPSLRITGPTRLRHARLPTLATRQPAGDANRNDHSDRAR